MTTSRSNVKTSPNLERLVNQISDGRCIPFIGSEAYSEWRDYYPPRKIDIASNWKNENKYPLAIHELEEYYKKARENYQYPIEDSQELAKIAQFLAVEKEDETTPKYMLSEVLKKITPPNFSLPEYKDTAFSVLSDLNLPIYITTNYDHYMEAALKSKGKEPVSEFCRWNQKLENLAIESGISQVFDRGYDPDSEAVKLKYRPAKQARKYEPSPAQPLVYHLLGVEEYPESMVLTEKDYIDFVIDINTRTPNPIPAKVSRGLSASTLLFVGYRLEDITFRVIFQGVFRLFDARLVGPASVAVQLPFKELRDAETYLNKYTKTVFRIDVSWCPVEDFCVSLREQYNMQRAASDQVQMARSGG